MKIIIFKTAPDYILEYYLKNYINKNDKIIIYSNKNFYLEKNNIKTIHWGHGFVSFFFLLRFFFIKCDKIICLTNNEHLKGYAKFKLVFSILFNKNTYFFSNTFKEYKFSFFTFFNIAFKEIRFTCSTLFFFIFYIVKINLIKQITLKKNYIFFADESLAEPLVYKQGLFFVKTADNFNKKIVCTLENINNYFFAPIYLKKLNNIYNENKDIIFYHTPQLTPCYFFDHLLTKYSIFNTVCYLFYKYRPETIHCRRVAFMPPLLKLKKRYNFKLIFDPRGDILSEEIYKETFKNKINKFYKFKNLWINCFKYSDKIILVSNEWKKYVNKKMKINKKIYIIPAGLNKIPDKTYLLKIREHLRKKYKLENKIVIGYSGSLAKWQQIELIVNFVEKLIKNYSDIFFIGFCYPAFLKISFEKYFIQHNIIKESYKILYVAPEESINYLSMLDVSILFRRKGIFSKIAFPIKISEYLVAGNFLITNDSMPEVSKVIKNLNIGMIIDENNFNIEKIYSKISKLNKSELLDKGIKYCSEYRLLDNYKKLYNEIISQ